MDIDPYHSAIISLSWRTEPVSIDATGDLTTLPANEKYTYIKLVSFNLPDSAQPDISDAITYVLVEFYVPDTPMDAAVGETLYARLRFTWSTAEKTDDTSLKVDDTTAAGDSSITGEEIVDVNWKTSNRHQAGNQLRYPQRQSGSFRREADPGRRL